MKIVVAGTGTMGAGIVDLLIGSDRKVIWLTSKKEPLDLRALERSASKLVARKQRKGMLVADNVDSLLTVSNERSCIGGADYLFEAISEDIEIKTDFYLKVAGYLDDKTIVASNTSSLSIEKLAKSLKMPNRFLGVHFFNPAPVMKLVEVIKCRDTDDAVVSTILDFLSGLSKVPIIVRDSPGFVVNRLLMPLINEAVSVFHDGVANASEIDQAMMLGANHPIGPLKLADLIGIDVVVDILDTMHKETGRALFTPNNFLLEMIENGTLGRKTKKGFYQY